MADQYVPQEIEPKWQRKWEEDGLYRSLIDPDKPKHYALTMLPYPSGDLHIGHWYAMSPSDVRARYMRMKGYNVLFPIGFDAFGLPAENAAIQRGIHPHKWTLSNIAKMRQQLRSMGAMFDWEREAISCLPGYYRWSEWFFLKLYHMGLAYRKKSPVDFCPKCNTTLAREQVWGENRHCERCETPVIKKELEQWFWRITNYADELLDFSQIDWPERVVTMQTNWVGRSEGADVTFTSEEGDEIVVFTTRPDTLWGATFMVLAPEHPLVDKLTAPEHREEVAEYQFQASRQSEIERLSTEKEKTGVFIGAFAINPVNDARIPIWIADYVMMTYGTGAIMAVPSHDERDFQFAIKYGLPIIPVIDRPDGVAKSFVMKGATRAGFAEVLKNDAISFEEQNGSLYVTLSGEQIDLYIVLAQAHILPGCWVEIVGARWVFVFDDDAIPFDGVEAEHKILARCKELEPGVRDKQTVMEMLWGVEFYRDVLFHAEYGTMINSAEFSGTPGDVAKQKVTEWLAEKGKGKFAINYRLRDWLISRQRYWGAPIPIVYCDECGIVPVPYEDLPVLLPEDAEIPSTGENALKYHEAFLHTICPKCGGPATRETDTMDTFVCSSWYNYAYLSPYYKEGETMHADSMHVDPEEMDYWAPVDVYTGGIEHATMHLIYTRFFHKALRDMGITQGPEPMLQLRNQGQILGPDGQRMSKSRGNVIDPGEQVAAYGADAVRAYLMFGYRWSEGGPWNPDNIHGVVRWLNRVWSLILEPDRPTGMEAVNPEAVAALRRKVHLTVRQVSHDLEQFEFNTVVSALMELTNAIGSAREAGVDADPAYQEAVEHLLLLMAPVVPHIAEELWSRLGKEYSIHMQSWPVYDAEAARAEEVTLVLQVNGKVRDRVQVPAGIEDPEAKRIALASQAVQRYLEGKKPKQVIVVSGRLVNVVV
jgi:leucyl-tRNA synthetase